MNQRCVGLAPDGSIKSMDLSAADLAALPPDVAKALGDIGAGLWFVGPFDPEPRHYQVRGVLIHRDGWRRVELERVQEADSGEPCERPPLSLVGSLEITGDAKPAASGSRRRPRRAR